MGEPLAAGRSPGVMPVKLPWRYTKVGSIALSYDFYLGVPAGLLTGLIPALSEAATGMATTLLVAFGAALVAILAVVVAVKTILVSLLTDEYLMILERAEGGIKAAVRPYVVVAWVCGAGAFISFAFAVAWPAIPGRDGWLLWLAFALPAALTGWGLLGCVQLVGLSNFHVEQRAALLRAVREFRHRTNESARSS